MTDKDHLLLFFNRPREPCFMPKECGDRRTVLELPDHFFTDKYKHISNELSIRYSENAHNTIMISNIALPNINELAEIPYHSQFSLFLPKHRHLAGKLIDIFMGMRNVEDMMSVCSYCQLRINPYMFNYCLSVALLHRPDTKSLDIPTWAETFPHDFVDPKTFRLAREVTNIVPVGARMPVNIPLNFTAGPLEPEQKVAYFREDIGVNLHHWHWHMVYPFSVGGFDIVNKDRRGEMFYYMHQQIVARYNCERLCNDLGLVIRFDDFHSPIAEGYFPKMESLVASHVWSPRDLERAADGVDIEVSQLELWRDRIIEAIDNGYVLLPDGGHLPLDEENGINTLGNMIESSILSPNQEYYGELHNTGHVFIALSQDPDGRNLEQLGVMGVAATAMRDPVFYRWHSYIDDIFQRHKANIPPYSMDKLNFPGIHVTSVSLKSRDRENQIFTQWEQSKVDLARGLDFTPRGPLLALFQHLQHDDFSYVIKVSNTTGQSVTATVRIFLAPVYDDHGQQFNFEDQRRMMVELDKFTQPINPDNNTIIQRSVDSSVTIPFERTFRDQSARQGDPGSKQTAAFDFCGCGWPHHLLVPKGTTKGFPIELFVMLSNWNEDGVEQDTVGSCNDAASYCGIRDRKYPDRRAMGFPFDRPARSGVSSLKDFLTPNMAVQSCNITFTDATRKRGQ